MLEYEIVDDADLKPGQAARLDAAAAEAEAGYTDEQLDAALRRAAGRPLQIGDTPASTIVQVRLDDARAQRLDGYAERRHLTRSAAVRELLDNALAAA